MVIQFVQVGGMVLNWIDLLAKTMALSMGQGTSPANQNMVCLLPSHEYKGTVYLNIGHLLTFLWSVNVIYGQFGIDISLRNPYVFMFIGYVLLYASALLTSEVSIMILLIKFVHPINCLNLSQLDWIYLFFTVGKSLQIYPSINR